MTLALITLWVVVVLGVLSLMKMNAPANAEERRLADEEQIKYLKGRAKD